MSLSYIAGKVTYRKTQANDTKCNQLVTKKHIIRKVICKQDF